MDYYDREAKPIDMMGWAKLMEDLDYKRVAYDVIGPYTVSTVWLGLDHNFYEDELSRPLIFETMVFSTDEWNDSGRSGLYDMGCWRWHTESEAREGHEEVMLTVRATYQETIQVEHERED